MSYFGQAKSENMFLTSNQGCYPALSWFCVNRVPTFQFYDLPEIHTAKTLFQEQVP